VRQFHYLCDSYSPDIDNTHSFSEETMTNEELIRAALSTIESGNVDESAKYFADDMTFSGPVPEPIGKDAFLAVHRAMLTGIPNWKFNFEKVGEDGDQVIGRVQITGTQTNELPPVLPGLPAVPATNRSVTNPVEGIKIVCQGGLIKSLEAEVVPNGGVAGVLGQLGVDLPH
jgi:predicted ester cyclase